MRRLSIICIFLQHETQVERVCAIIEKFRPFTTFIDIDVDRCSSHYYFSLVRAALDVDELRLRVPSVLEETTQQPVVQLRLFSKLKSLELYSSGSENENFPDAFKLCSQNLFHNITDDSLEVLSIYNVSEIFDEVFLQEFLNRQMKIESLEIDPPCYVSIDHLVLSELDNALDEKDVPGGLKALLDKQLKLCTLRLGNANDATFGKVCQMRNLESLCTSLDLEDKTSIERMNNLQNLTYLELIDDSESELEFWPGSLSLSQVKLPKLKSLQLSITDHLDPQLFVGLGLNMENLQELYINTMYRINFLPQVVENMKTLKNLTVLQSQDEVEANDFHSIPTHQNASVEILDIMVENGGTERWQPAYDAANACPNLKIICFHGIRKVDAGLFDCIQKHAQLKRFWFEYATSNVPEQNTDEQDPLLIGIIEHFLNSPDFDWLQIREIPAFKKQLFEKCLAKVPDIVIINSRTTEYLSGGEPCLNLTISKKP